MTSLVLELQRFALEETPDYASLARRALVVATKLGVADFRIWAERELNGFVDVAQSDLPDYRNIHVSVQYFNRYHGWQPIVFGDPELARLTSSTGMYAPIGQVQHLVNSVTSSGVIQIPLPHEITQQLMQGMNMRAEPTFIVPPSELFKVLDAVRNRILQWSMDLEAAGVLGNDMTFSDQEKQKATGQSEISIGSISNFHGSIGPVNSSHIQVGDAITLHAKLIELGVGIRDRQELECIVDDLEKEPGQKEKTSLMKRGLAWIAKHSSTLGTFSSELRKWFE